MIKIAMTVAASMPPITVVPRMCRELAPAPVDSTSGSTPRMKANAVMRIGRRRRRAPASAASTSDAPRSCSTLANSTMRIAFLAARPITMTRPICENTSSSKCASQSAATAPRTAMGVPSSTPNGSVQLSYSAARSRKTTSSEKPKTAAGGMPCAATFSWNDMPE